MKIKRSSDKRFLKEKSRSDAIGKTTGFFLFRNLIKDYNQAKNDDSIRINIKKYGICSIILSSIAFLLSGSCLLSQAMDFSLFGFSNILITIIYIVGGVIISLLLAIYACVFAIMQLRLNRKAIGVIGLILGTLAIVTGIGNIVFIFI